MEVAATTTEQTAKRGRGRPPFRSALLTLPMPPSANNAWINIAGRGRARSREYQSWLEQAGWTIRIAKIEKIPGRISVTMRAAIPKRSRDLDNCGKLILDALVRFAVVEDDRHVMRLSLEWAVDVPENTIEVRVSQASSPETRHRVAVAKRAGSVSAIAVGGK